MTIADMIEYDKKLKRYYERVEKQDRVQLIKRCVEREKNKERIINVPNKKRND